MRYEIRDRVIEEGRYIAETGATVRAVAKVFLSSKSTVHKDVTERLKGIDKNLYERVQVVLKKNLDERHIRGGEATKQKYLKQKID